MNILGIIATWAVTVVVAWAIVYVGSGEPKYPDHRPPQHWAVPFSLSEREREANRLPYGRLV